MKESSMRHFLPIAGNVDVIPLLSAIYRKPELWKEDTYLRGCSQGTIPGDVESILLRFPTERPMKTVADLEEYNKSVDRHESVDYAPFSYLTEARKIVFALMAQVEGERLGRVIINKIRPGGSIPSHKDGRDHAEYYDRHHVVLQSAAGCNFKAEDETVHMPAGSVWWFNNAVDHEVVNNSSVERIHLIVDIRTRSYRA